MATKKTASKTAPKKKPTSRTTKTTKKSPKKPVEQRSFRSYPEDTPFFTLRFTRQSLYWLVLSLVVLGMGIWVLYLNVKVQDIYDRIDMANASQSDIQSLYLTHEATKD